MTFGKKGLAAHPATPAAAPAEHGTQREARLHRLMKVAIYHERFGHSDAVIRDISSGGLGGRCSAKLLPGDVIEIDRAGLGRFEAEIRWVRNGHFGAQLTSDLRIDPAAIDTLAFNGRAWDQQVNKPLEHHVFTRFRPMQSTYRPAVASPRRDK